MPHLLESSIHDLKSSLDTIRGMTDHVDQSVDIIVECLSSNGKLLVCGNGGSAADSAHFASEFVGRFIADRRSFPAICLPAEASSVTGIANDYSYEEVFARQVRGFGRPGDTLVVFSSSGNSANLIHALTAAKESGLKSIALLGRDGGKTAGMADAELIVPGRVTARIQECQKLLLHVICELAELRLPKEY